MRADYTHIAILLDRSGSMQDIKSDIVGGFNNLITKQKAEPGKLTITLVQFDDHMGTMQFETLQDFADVQSVTPLTDASYDPRGSTPLNDAFAQLIKVTGERLAAMPEEDRPSKVLIVCITDGLENASREYSTKALKDLIEKQRSEWKWEFLYIGANQDSFAEGGKRGVSKSMNFKANAAGVSRAYATMDAAFTKYRSSGKLEVDEEDKK